MKQSLFFGAFLLAGALASPVGRREVVVDLTVVTRTVTVTGGVPEQTPPPPPPPAPKPTPKPPVEEPEEDEEESETPDEKSPPPAPKPSPKPPVEGGPPSEEPEKPEEQPEEDEDENSPPPPPPKPSTTAPPPAPEPTTAPPPANKAPADDYQSVVLHQHNIHRANHSAADLTWSKDLEGTAEQLAKSCVYDHNTQYSNGKYGGGGDNYGQNMGYQSNSGGGVAAMITNLMYNGEEPLFVPFYGVAQPDKSDFTGWGHFTQIVWQKTTEVGCVTHTCDLLQVPGGSSVENADFTVCNYGPPGNYANEYANNVKKPLGHPTVTV